MRYSFAYDHFAGDSGVSSPGPSSEASLSSQKNPDLSYMDRVVMEVIESESVYVRDLHQVVHVQHFLSFQIHCSLSIQVSYFQFIGNLQQSATFFLIFHI